MTREENLLYRRQCPYDAMGDYSVLMENEKNIKAERNAKNLILASDGNKVENIVTIRKGSKEVSGSR